MRELSGLSLMHSDISLYGRPRLSFVKAGAAACAAVCLPGKILPRKKVCFTPPDRRCDQNDWLLMLKDETEKYRK